MTEKIFRNGGVVQWSDKIGTAIKKLEDMPEKRLRRTYAFYGPKGVGKSTMLEFVDEHFEANVVEGDAMAMLATALHLDADENEALGQWTNSADPTPWAAFTPEQRTGFVKQYLGFALDKIDVATAFRGWKSNVKLIIFPDYRMYVKQYKARTKFMLEKAKSSDGFKKHIRENHLVLSYEEFMAEIESNIKGDEPTFFVPNLGSDKVLDSFFGTLFDDCDPVMESVEPKNVKS